jgi:hypothetical protein
MNPLVSALKETPSSTGESGPTSTTDGTVLLGQIVYWADALPAKVKAKTKTRAAKTNLAYATIRLDWHFAGEKFPLREDTFRVALPKNRHKSIPFTTTPLNWFFLRDFPDDGIAGLGSGEVLEEQGLEVLSVSWPRGIGRHPLRFLNSSQHSAHSQELRSVAFCTLSAVK